MDREGIRRVAAAADVHGDDDECWNFITPYSGPGTGIRGLH